MNRYGVNKLPEGDYGLTDECGQLLRTPAGKEICTKNLGFISVLADDIGSQEPEADGFSLYGLVAAYIDFGYRVNSDEMRRALVSALDDDPITESPNRRLLERLSESEGFTVDVADCLAKFKGASPEQVCAMINYVTCFGSARMACHIILGGAMPGYVARALCGIYSHVSQFEGQRLREAALQGAFVDQESLIAVNEDSAEIIYCRSCIDQKPELDSRCSLIATVSKMKLFASFEAI